MISLLWIKSKPGFIFMKTGTCYNTADNKEKKIKNLDCLRHAQMVV